MNLANEKDSWLFQTACTNRYKLSNVPKNIQFENSRLRLSNVVPRKEKLKNWLKRFKKTNGELTGRFYMRPVRVFIAQLMMAVLINIRLPNLSLRDKNCFLRLLFENGWLRNNILILMEMIEPVIGVKCLKSVEKSEQFQQQFLKFSECQATKNKNKIRAFPDSIALLEYEALSWNVDQKSNCAVSWEKWMSTKTKMTSYVFFAFFQVQDQRRKGFSRNISD